MAQPRLTPNQKERFLGVARNWGPVFKLYWDNSQWKRREAMDCRAAGLSK